MHGSCTDGGAGGVLSRSNESTTESVHSITILEPNGSFMQTLSVEVSASIWTNDPHGAEHAGHRGFATFGGIDGTSYRKSFVFPHGSHTLLQAHGSRWCVATAVSHSRVAQPSHSRVVTQPCNSLVTAL